MNTYTYTGTERSAAGGKMIVPTGIYELDEKDPRVVSLVARGLLVEQKQPPKPETKPDLKTNEKTKK